MRVVPRVQQVRDNIRDLLDALYLAEQELLILEARNKFLEAENELLKRDLQAALIDNAPLRPREAPTRFHGVSID